MLISWLRIQSYVPKYRIVWLRAATRQRKQGEGGSSGVSSSEEGVIDGGKGRDRRVQLLYIRKRLP